MSDSCPHSDPGPAPAHRSSARVPAWVPAALALAALAALAVAVTVRGSLGAALVGLVAATVAALTALSWPQLSLPARAARAAVLTILVAGALVLGLPR